MAGFTSPSILFLSTWDAPERAYMAELLPKLRAAGYTEYHEPSVGGFAMPLVAVEHGWTPEEMVTSDTHLFTSVLGELNAGRDMSKLGVETDGMPVEFPSDDPLDQAAHLLWTQFLFRMYAKPEEAHYWQTMIEDLTQNADWHRSQLRGQLAKMAGRLKGIHYRALSFWDHIEQFADNPKAVIISNPPTYRGAYEKFFDTKGRLTWNVPDYEVFDAPVDIPRAVEFMEGKKALLVIQQQQTVRNSAHAHPPYARQLAPGEMVYVNTNRPEEVKNLLGGFRVVPRRLTELGTRPWPIIPKDHPVELDSKVELVEVESKVADAYRAQWMHRLHPVPGSGNVLVLIDGMAAGVIGYSLASMSASFSRKWERHPILRFAFGAKHDTLRLTRLATMLALQHSTLVLTESPATAMHVASAEGLVTVEYTRHPEAKGLRGLMKLEERADHQDGYKLVYAGPWLSPQSPSEVLASFLAKESKWSSSRKADTK